MVVPISNNNTPVRNRKVGMGNNDAQSSVPTSPYAPAPMVQQMAQQQYALENGGEHHPVMQGNETGTPPPIATVAPFNGNRIVGKFEAPVVNPQPQQNETTPVTNFENMPNVPQFNSRSYGNANPGVGPTQLPYMGDAADTTPQNVTNFEGMQPSGNGRQWNPLENTSDVGYKNGPYDPSQYASLSEALNDNVQPEEKAPEFNEDKSKRDGGFFGWLKSLVPKSRPGKRAGESDDDYDRRMTTNRERLAVLADAMRHMGNIYNTSKYAPLQTFNSPITDMENAYQTRSAQRKAQAKLDADKAKNDAEMDLKQKAAEADRNYKALTLNLKQQAADRAADKDKFDRDYKNKTLQRMLDNDAFSHDLANKKFGEQKRHNGVAEQQGAARIALSQERNGIARARLANSIANGGGSGGGGKGSSTVNLSSPAGHLNRKKELSTVEKKQLTQYLIKNGYINKTNLDAYNNYVTMGDTKNVSDLQNYWIAYAANMPGKKGDTFRTTLKNHYMYKETTTTSTQSATAKNGGGSGGGKSGKSGQNGKTGNKGKSGKGWASGFKI